MVDNACTVIESMCYWHCFSSPTCPESLSQQRSQSDEKVTKMKALLVKSKKELAEAKKQVSTLRMIQQPL